MKLLQYIIFVSSCMIIAGPYEDLLKAFRTGDIQGVKSALAQGAIKGNQEKEQALIDLRHIADNIVGATQIQAFFQALPQFLLDLLDNGATMTPQYLLWALRLPMSTVRLNGLLARNRNILNEPINIQGTTLLEDFLYHFLAFDIDSYKKIVLHLLLYGGRLKKIGTFNQDSLRSKLYQLYKALYSLIDIQQSDIGNLLQILSQIRNKDQAKFYTALALLIAINERNLDAIKQLSKLPYETNTVYRAALHQMNLFSRDTATVTFLYRVINVIHPDFTYEIYEAWRGMRERNVPHEIILLTLQKSYHWMTYKILEDIINRYRHHAIRSYEQKMTPSERYSALTAELMKPHINSDYVNQLLEHPIDFLTNLPRNGVPIIINQLIQLQERPGSAETTDAIATIATRIYRMVAHQLYPTQSGFNANQLHQFFKSLVD